MDKDIIEMSRDNKWMSSKIEDYHKELREIQAYVTSLENENIRLMKYLFECQNEELKSVKNIFQTQFVDGENLEFEGIMEVDLTKLDSGIFKETIFQPYRVLLKFNQIVF
jgi:hypothetical protein